MSSLAVDQGKTVLIISDDVTYTVTKEEYTKVKDIFTYGIDEDEVSCIIRPHDIIGYLEETNPEAQHNALESAVMIAKRQMKDELTVKFVWAFIILALILGSAIAYTIISGSTTGSEAGIVESAGNAVTIG